VRWPLNVPRELPEIEPLIPVPRADAFDAPAYLFEPKYDGLRGLLFMRGPATWFQSKRGHALPHFDELALWVRQELGNRHVILDGEVVALDTNGRQDLHMLLAGRGQPHYAAFDVLWKDGKDLRGQPLRERKRALERLIPSSTSVLSRVHAVEERGRDLYRAATRLDLEGIVAKRAADPYRPGTVWYTIMNRGYSRLRGGGNSSRRSGASPRPSPFTSE
jgi:bifunctional non-homologous end joining protein LigD